MIYPDYSKQDAVCPEFVKNMYKYLKELGYDV